MAVAWQGGVLVGVVGAERDAPAAEALDLRPAIAWVEGDERLSAPLRWVIETQARRSAVPVGVSLAQIAGPMLKGPWRHRVRRAASAPAVLFPQEGAPTLGEGWVEAAAFDAAVLEEGRRHALIEESVAPQGALEQRWVAVRPPDEGLLGGGKAGQRRVLELALAAPNGAGWPSAAAMARELEVPLGAVRSLVAKGYLAQRELPTPPAPTPWEPPGAFAAHEPFVVAQDELAVAAAMELTATHLVSGGRARARFARALGAVVAAVAAGRQALLMVPDAALAEVVAAACAAHVPTLRWSNDLPEGVRLALASELRAGTPALLVGTPAALAVELPTLAFIALWDAASGATKQRSGARSVAWRDAIELGRASGAPVMLLDPLASAELRAAASAHQRLPHERPRSALIDLRSEPGWPLSASLVRLLRQVVERGRQAVVISSRRGYASGLACRSCGGVEMCPNCDVALRYYARSARLRCHRCGHTAAKPERCSSCHQGGLEPRPGAGTEWVAEAVAGVIRDLNPEARVWVYDRDQRDDLSALEGGACGVLVGTLALLRRPPLPNLSLVALTHGDSLHDHEDVRAEEGAMRTLLQLPELASAGRRPLLVAQVHHPEHALWQAWTSEDLDGAIALFEGRVSERRAAFGYPPARVWARVQLSHRDERTVAAAARELAGQLALMGADLIGPAPAPIARTRGRYAHHLFLRARSDDELAERLTAVPGRMKGGVVVRCDVDPYDLEDMLQ